MPNSEFVLRTVRLDLVAATLEHLEAELHSPDALAALLRASLPAGWPPGEYDRDAIEHFRTLIGADAGRNLGWYNWYAMTRDAEGERDTVVAAAGYFGPPSEAVVEIGYSVVPAACRQGFATEIVKALVANAFSRSSIEQVIARTSDANVASNQVLLRCGFRAEAHEGEPHTLRYCLRRPPTT